MNGADVRALYVHECVVVPDVEGIGLVEQPTLLIAEGIVIVASERCVGAEVIEPSVYLPNPDSQTCTGVKRAHPKVNT